MNYQTLSYALLLAGAAALAFLAIACGDDALPTSGLTDRGAEDPSGADGGVPGGGGAVPPTQTGQPPATSGAPGTSSPSGAPSTSVVVDSSSSTPIVGSGTTGPTTGLCAGALPEPRADGPPGLDALVTGAFQVSSADIASIPVHDGYTYRARVFWPEDAAGERPAQIFMPGFQLDGDEFYWYGEALASHGHVVLVPTVGDSLGNPRTHSDLGDDVVQLVGWLRNATQEAGSPLQGRVSPERIAAGGHSRGGKAAILAATRDERIRASFTLDPVDANPPAPFQNRGLSVAPELMGEFRIPGLFLGTGKGSVATGGIGGFGAQACAPEGENWESYFTSAAGPVYGVLVENAGHNDFAEECRSGGGGGGFLPTACSACPAGDEPDWNVELAIALSAAFHALWLEDDASCRSWLNGAAMDALAPWAETGTRNLND